MNIFKKDRKLIYVAHPYSNMMSNKKSVELIIKELSLRHPDNVYISPIHTFGFLYTAVSYELGMEYCKALLNKCDLVIFCPRWETSRGCNLEMQHCIDNKIPWEVQE